MLHGEIREDSVVIGDWEAQPLDAHNGTESYEYRFDLNADGVPQRFTGNFAVPAGTDSVVVAASVLKRAAEYL